jgi:hypothetical protein
LRRTAFVAVLVSNLQKIYFARVTGDCFAAKEQKRLATTFE